MLEHKYVQLFNEVDALKAEIAQTRAPPPVSNASIQTETPAATSVSTKQQQQDKPKDTKRQSTGSGQDNKTSKEPAEPVFRAESTPTTSTAVDEPIAHTDSVSTPSRTAENLIVKPVQPSRYMGRRAPTTGCAGRQLHRGDNQRTYNAITTKTQPSAHSAQGQTLVPS